MLCINYHDFNYLFNPVKREQEVIHLMHAFVFIKITINTDDVCKILFESLRKTEVLIVIRLSQYIIVSLCKQKWDKLKDTLTY